VTIAIDQYDLPDIEAAFPDVGVSPGRGYLPDLWVEGEASNELIREDELQDSVGHEVFDKILEHHRHRLDEEGLYWLRDELDDILELIEIEREEAPEP
jgi:hypothetical protein